MRLPLFALGSAALLAVLTSCAAVPEPQGPMVPQYEIEHFLDTTSYRGSSFSADGSRVLVSSDSSGVYNAYAISVNGGEPQALTRSESDSIFAVSYFPDDDRFLFTKDQGGNEHTHLYVQEASGTTVDLTPGESLKAMFGGWAHDQNSFFVLTNERNPAAFDLYEIQIDDYERTELFQNEEGLEFAAISPNRRFLAFQKHITRTNSDLYLFDRQSKEMRHLTPHEGEIAFQALMFSPTEKMLYFLTDEGHEFQYLKRMDFSSGRQETVYKTDWDVAGAELSQQGRFLVVRVNQDARTEVLVFEANGMRPVELPGLPEGDITSLRVSRNEEKIALYASGARLPGDLFVYDLKKAASRQLTRSLSDEIQPQFLVEGEVVRFKSYDELEVPGILYRPHQATPANPAPALVWVHGGPGGQSRIGYSTLIQYLVNHGYVIYAINNRGSSGYGKTFFSLDDRRHGDADLDDCVSSKQMLVDTGYVDPDRIGIVGGSYGGYMVLAALAFRPDAFALGVDIFGVSNWLRTLEEMPVWWGPYRDALIKEIGDPVADRDYLQRISPVFHAGNIQKPLMVLQGANDPRVLQAESDDIVAAVQKNNVPVDYIVFPDEGHGFLNKKNRTEGYRKILEFLNKHLKPKPAVVEP